MYLYIRLFNKHVLLYKIVTAQLIFMMLSRISVKILNILYCTHDTLITLGTINTASTISVPGYPDTFRKSLRGSEIYQNISYCDPRKI